VLRHTMRLAGSKRSDVKSAHSMGHITLLVLAECFFFKETVQAMEKEFVCFFRVAHKER